MKGGLINIFPRALANSYQMELVMCMSGGELIAYSSAAPKKFLRSICFRRLLHGYLRPGFGF